MIRVLCFAPGRVFPAQYEAGRPADVYPLTAASEAELLSYLSNASYDALLAWLPVDGVGGSDILRQIRGVDSSIPVIFVQDVADVEEAVQFTKLGVYQVLKPGVDATRLFDTIRSAAMCPRQERSGQDSETWRKALVGSSSPMERVAEVIRLVAARRSTVLVTGETGTGKELVARAVHEASGRGHLPMVAVNCSAIPENLLEAELFGYVKGAFTGAVQNRPGRFEQADGSTIFLDEIGDLPLDLQAKLLRVLQEREVQRLGSSETIRLNIRVVAATNLDLEEQVEAKRFRQDLFYRLSVVPLRVPSLRERRDDIPALVHHFIRKICLAEGIRLKTVAEGALAALAQLEWPGNVRQLEHAVEMAVVLSGNRTELVTADFRNGERRIAPERAYTNAPIIQVPDEGLDFDDIVGRLERSIVEQALAKSGGNKARAADLLRMKRTTLLAKMKTFDFALGSACA